jgi:hypothetical protein
MIGERIARFGPVERDERDPIADFAQQFTGSRVDFDPTFCHLDRSRCSRCCSPTIHAW